MPKLFQNHDGASAAAQAVLAYLSSHDGIEESWDTVKGRYKACPTVARWHNCREQGYVVSMQSGDYSKQINIAFFEHRNYDNICAIKWEQITINPPTIETMNTKGTVYKDKYDVSKEFSYDECTLMAEWIYKELTHFWVSTLSP